MGCDLVNPAYDQVSIYENDRVIHHYNVTIDNCILFRGQWHPPIGLKYNVCTLANNIPLFDMTDLGSFKPYNKIGKQIRYGTSIRFMVSTKNYQFLSIHFSLNLLQGHERITAQQRSWAFVLNLYLW